MFRTVFKLEKFSDPSNPNYQPQWRIRHKEERTGRLGVKPKSTRTNFELYLGKNQGEGISLCVTQPADIPPEGTNDPVAFQNILDNSPGNEDNDDGYRGKITLSNGNIVTELKFGSFDFNPEDLRPHPAVFGCWGGGPVMTEGHSDPDYRKIRTYQQIFTDKINGTYRSRGMDELFFDSGTPVFHPNNSNIIMIGCTDNPLLRSEDGGESWSHIRLRNPGDWFGGKQHHVYHIAFHPQNSNVVLASGGSANHHPNDRGRGALFINVNGGVGDGMNAWPVIGGSTDGSQEALTEPSFWSNGLPIGEIQSFVFDRRDEELVLVAVRHKGIYYGRVRSDGSVVSPGFQKITDPELTAMISAADGPRHYYSRILFDPGNTEQDKDYLYVARHWPSGGVFRIKLESNRATWTPSNCIQAVDEIIKGRWLGIAEPAPDVYTNDNNVASEVISLLVTDSHVFAGATPGHLNKAGDNHTGGLMVWNKTSTTPPNENEWIIGGAGALPSSDATSKTIGIGGLVKDSSHPHTIFAVTYRFRLRGDNGTKLKGEDNYKFMNLWQIEVSQNNQGQDVFAPSRLSNSTILHKWADAMTMAPFPNDPNKIIMPTHGNGIWIGARPSTPPPIPKTTTDFLQQNKNLPQRFALHPNYPNPFNPATTIRYDLPKAVRVTLRILDVLGHQVRLLVHADEDSGFHNVIWDGHDDNHNPVASGVYFYQLDTSEFTKTMKTMLLR